ncbi:MAG: hypothetical protein ACK4JD_10850 [Thermoflexales bacterium]
MSCVNCQCEQNFCYRYCDYRRLPSLCGACEVQVVVLPNSDLKMGTPLARLPTGEYTAFNPSATPPQQFAGLLAIDWETDSDGYGYVNTPWHPYAGWREAPMYVGGTFRIADLDITTAQLNAIIAQGRGAVIGDPNTLSGTLHLF